MDLVAENLTFYYRGRKKQPVLEHVDLTIRQGERVGLKAPSGRGKTTLCKLLAGYERPKQGRVLAGGTDVMEYKGVCPVQMIWQHPERAMNPRLTLGESLKEADNIDRQLEIGLGIEPDWKTRYPQELSGGELQRFCIARALGQRTRYLIADEISTMLDLITQGQIWNFLMEETARRQIGMLVVSHSKDLLDYICTRQIRL